LQKVLERKIEVEKPPIQVQSKQYWNCQHLPRYFSVNPSGPQSSSSPGGRTTQEQIQ